MRYQYDDMDYIDYSGSSYAGEVVHAIVVTIGVLLVWGWFCRNILEGFTADLVEAVFKVKISMDLAFLITFLSPFVILGLIALFAYITK